jgi:two-component system CheB/CheR fusion protein
MTSENHVFVVDEEQAARNRLTSLLRKASYAVRGFSSSVDFLAALDPGTSGCVVVDASISLQSAEELSAELAARGIDLAIIVVADDDNPETRRKARRMKALAFLRKPVDDAAITDMVNWSMQRGL